MAGAPFTDPPASNTPARRKCTVRALITFYGLTWDECVDAFAEVVLNESEGRRPCPACPDGYRWTADGQTRDACITCGGTSWVAL